MIIFLSCTKQKQNATCMAKEMYSASQWFRGGYLYALSLKPERVYILSAKYGLLSPEQVISPYNQTLSGARDGEVRRWSTAVYRQMVAQGINFNDEAVFLCGKNYRKYLQRLFPKAQAPLKHLGIGRQMQFFKENTK